MAPSVQLVQQLADRECPSAPTLKPCQAVLSAVTSVRRRSLNHCPATDISVPLSEIYCTYHVTDTYYVRPPGFCHCWSIRLEQSSGPCPQSELHRSCFQAPAKYTHGTSPPNALGGLSVDALYKWTHWHWHWHLPAACHGVSLCGSKPQRSQRLVIGGKTHSPLDQTPPPTEARRRRWCRRQISGDEPVGVFELCRVRRIRPGPAQFYDDERQPSDDVRGLTGAVSSRLRTPQSRFSRMTSHRWWIYEADWLTSVRLLRVKPSLAHYINLRISTDRLAKTINSPRTSDRRAAIQFLRLPEGASERFKNWGMDRDQRGRRGDLPSPAN